MRYRQLADALEPFLVVKGRQVVRRDEPGVGIDGDHLDSAGR